MRLAIGILSSFDDGSAASEIAEVIGLDHAVVVHHDFGKQPKYELKAANAVLLERPASTSWGGWSLVEAALLLIEKACEFNFDYFQLLSESCLPVRPIEEFEAFLDEHRPDAMIGLLEVSPAHPIVLSHYGHRYLPSGHILRKAVARANAWWRGRAMPTHEIAIAGVNVPDLPPATGLAPQGQRLIGKVAFRVLSSRFVNRHPFSRSFRCFVGSQFFCLSRTVAEHVLDVARTNDPLVKHFTRTMIPDEAFIQTIVGNGGFERVLPPNHFLRWDQRKTGPDILDDSDFPSMLKSGRFFARKFRLDAHDGLRLRVLHDVRGFPGTVA